MTRKCIIMILAIIILCVPSLARAQVYAITQTWLKGDFSTDNVAQYSLPSTAASTTATITPIAISQTFRGYLTRVEVSCSSTDYDIAILQRNSTAAIDTVDEIYSYSTINKSLNDAIDPAQPFVNNNYTSATFDPLTNTFLYFRVKNDDAVNATGRINLKLTYKGRK